MLREKLTACRDVVHNEKEAPEDAVLGQVQSLSEIVPAFSGSGGVEGCR
jgi:hypothetical protein